MPVEISVWSIIPYIFYIEAPTTLAPDEPVQHSQVTISVKKIVHYTMIPLLTNHNSLKPTDKLLK